MALGFKPSIAPALQYSAFFNFFKNCYWLFCKNVVLLNCKHNWIPHSLFQLCTAIEKMEINHFLQWWSNHVSSWPLSYYYQKAEISRRGIWPWCSLAYPSNKKLQLAVKVRNMVKSFGGKWNKDKKVWELAYKYVVELGLRDRVISDKKNVYY